MQGLSKAGSLVSGRIADRVGCAGMIALVLANVLVFVFATPPELAPDPYSLPPGTTSPVPSSSR